MKTIIMTDNVTRVTITIDRTTVTAKELCGTHRRTFTTVAEAREAVGCLVARLTACGFTIVGDVKCALLTR